jgi:outer membrane protein
MKRSLVLWIVLALAALPAAAQTSELGLWISQSRVGETDDEEAVLEFDNGDGFGVSYNHFFGNALSLEISATRLSHDGNLRDSSGAIEFDAGSLDITPIVGTIQFHFGGTGGIVSPYVGGGVAYIMADDLDPEDIDGVEFGPAEVDDAITWAVQAGVDFNIGERFAIGVDAKYTGYTPDAASADFPDDSLELDLNPLIISAGFKIRW